MTDLLAWGLLAAVVIVPNEIDRARNRRTKH